MGARGRSPQTARGRAFNLQQQEWPDLSQAVAAPRRERNKWGNRNPERSARSQSRPREALFRQATCPPAIHLGAPARVVPTVRLPQQVADRDAEAQGPLSAVRFPEDLPRETSKGLQTKTAKQNAPWRSGKANDSDPLLLDSESEQERAPAELEAKDGEGLQMQQHIEASPSVFELHSAVRKEGEEVVQPQQQMEDAPSIFDQIHKAVQNEGQEMTQRPQQIGNLPSVFDVVATEAREPRKKRSSLPVGNASHFADWLEERPALLRMDRGYAGKGWEFPLSRCEKRELLLLTMAAEREAQEEHIEILQSQGAEDESDLDISR